jgi:hypothetical protein
MIIDLTQFYNKITEMKDGYLLVLSDDLRKPPQFRYWMFLYEGQIYTLGADDMYKKDIEYFVSSTYSIDHYVETKTFISKRKSTDPDNTDPDDILYTQGILVIVTDGDLIKMVQQWLIKNKPDLALVYI